MNSHKNIIATFEDKYGQERIIHSTKDGLKLARLKPTLLDKLNPVISDLVGKKIKQYRKEAGLSLEGLCVRAGLVSSTPKNRMWEIENNVRKQGTRLGTIYLIAIALGVEVSELLPTISEVKKSTKIKEKKITTLDL